MIISVVAAKNMVAQKMYGFYWATVYILHTLHTTMLALNLVHI